MTKRRSCDRPQALEMCQIRKRRLKRAHATTDAPRNVQAVPFPRRIRAITNMGLMSHFYSGGHAKLRLGKSGCQHRWAAQSGPGAYREGAWTYA